MIGRSNHGILRRWWLALLALVAVAVPAGISLVASSAAQAATNLITDGQFNDTTAGTAPTSGSATEPTAGTTSATDIPGWTVTSGSVDWINNYWNGPSAGDNYTVDLNGSGPGTLEQGVTTTIGAPYRLSFELSANPNCQPNQAQLEVAWNGTAVGTYAVTPTWDNSSMQYTSESLTVSGTGSDVLDFTAINAGACGPVIADVALLPNPANTPPTINAPSTSSATYDRAITPITVTASDGDGDTVTLGATNVPSGLSFNATTGVLSGTPTVNPGPYTITFSANDGVNPAVTANTLMTVAKDACDITNPLSILSSASAYTPLTATIEQSGTSNGLTGKSVNFSLLDSSSTAYGPYPSTSGTSGVANYNAPLPAGVYSMSANFPGDTQYTSCATSSATVVTVSPATYKVTGGGWISNGTGKTSFGFNVIPSVTGISGQLQIHTNKGDFHGNTVNAWSQSAKNSVSWTGTGKWNGNPATYQITVVDNGSGSGSPADTVSVTITSGATTLWSSGGSQPLKGGNITVH